jgi:hypothetical protein
MKNKMEDKMIKIKLLIMVLIVLGSVQGYGLIYHNDIIDPFPDPERKLMEGYHVSGASFFLQSQSVACLLLNEYEISSTSFDFPAATGYVKKAIFLLEAALNEYQKSKTLGIKCGVDLQKTTTLKGFDYSSITSGMVPDIAGKVVKYFENGDILGIYQENVTNISNILESLQYIKSQLEQGKKPGVEYFWKLYQQYSEAALFGNYATIIGRSAFGG